MLRCFLSALLVLLAGGVSHAKTVKVFILAGQSNMEGQAVADLAGKDYNEGRGTLKAVLADPQRAARQAPRECGRHVGGS